MTAIIETLNRTYHVREGRSWWRVRLLAVGLTVVLTAFTLAAVGLMMAGPTLAHQFENSLGVPRHLPAVGNCRVAGDLRVDGDRARERLSLRA